MKEALLAYVQSNHYQPKDARQLAAVFQATSAKAFTEFLKVLHELEYEGYVGFIQQNKIVSADKCHIARGTLDLKRQGFGFILRENSTLPDIFIPKGQLNTASDGDLCVVKITKTSQNKTEGAIVRILKRALEVIVGEYYQGAIFIKKGHDDDLFRVKPEDRKRLIDHSIVKAKIVRYSAQRIYDCEILEVIGHATDPGIEILEIMAEHHLATSFPDVVKKEVETLPLEVLPEDLVGRSDFRGDFIFTIDGDDTKDIDDAVSIEKLGNGYRLGVHIADVSYYVKENTELDKEAYQRGTSVYLADRVVPMLPRELSNGICSLNPSVDRLTISCLMTIDESGEIIDYSIEPSVIRSRYQMTYKIVNRLIVRDPETVQTFKEFVEPVAMMVDLAAILEKKRTKNGSINFETLEPKIVFDENGKVKDVVLRERGISENVIEEFMLIANQTVARHFDRADLPFIYRIHEKPDSEKVASLFQFAKGIGYGISLPKIITQKQLQQLLQKVDDTKYEKVINMMMLRSMAKAKYSETNLGHYGLAFDDYTHFTSPIRRYPDTTVHRLIRTYLLEKKTDDRTIMHYSTALPDIADATSKAERNAMLAEREVMDIKKAEFMLGKEGQVFEGVIAGLTRFGMFVELPNTVEGLVHISSFKEAVDFNEEKMVYLGITSRKEYTIGTIVWVKLLGVNPLKGQIDFELADKKGV